MASRTTRFPAPSSALGRLLAFVGLSAVAGLLVAALLLLSLIHISEPTRPY